MTHVMELRRVDGATSRPADAEPLLTALHVGVCFALGRWAAPMLPVGEGVAGGRGWEDWRLPQCDPARSISPGLDGANVATWRVAVTRLDSYPPAPFRADHDP